MRRNLTLHFFVINDEDIVLAQKGIDITEGLNARQKRKLALERFIREAEQIESKIRLKRLSRVKKNN